MKRKWVLIILAIIAAVSLTLNLIALIEDKTTKCESEQSTEYNGFVAKYSGEGVCEVIVDMGYVFRSSTVVETIRIVNNSATPLVLLDYSTQCRCMWLSFEREPIAAGAYRDIELTFDSRGEWGTVGNYMEITTSKDDAPVVLWIGAEIE